MNCCVLDEVCDGQKIALIESNLLVCSIVQRQSYNSSFQITLPPLTHLLSSHITLSLTALTSSSTSSSSLFSSSDSSSYLRLLNTSPSSMISGSLMWRLQQWHSGAPIKSPSPDYGEGSTLHSECTVWVNREHGQCSEAVPNISHKWQKLCMYVRMCYHRRVCMAKGIAVASTWYSNCEGEMSTWLEW